MRQIILDTETTGLEVAQGHRVIEIGALEMVDRRLTGERFHTYLDPERDIEQGALEVHGLSQEFLQDKPRFADIAGELLEFVGDSELVVHNAPFDLGFLDHELERLGHAADALSARGPVLDTLALARDLHPGQRNSLDALCKRYEVDSSARSLHGALLDAELLAEVYLAMTGGQEDLGLSLAQDSDAAAGADNLVAGERPALRVLRASAEELAAHRARLEAIREASGHCLWLEQEEGGPD
ncbi:MAG: DNA polymerase III subunit epsilon [Xanthomonadales bacterium]|uniref:DNA polymerase III subunit epsilon n=1 Tax=Hydrogenophaga sp. TaxID=1904254 RepID=UPI0016A152D0|nr:DNA polymerase III subunit epsilon [Hydrogenophaga sp.]NIM70562.1 DNA polymerase III subunit epsilon [Xanthomonadales bacterium]NIN32884.1 DNA polymerase III subunit epsilon [Hydrogenophaga sp.]NIN59937.1 DNA polymerase III subunit epsilon [Xanthomonadales bacterium]NIN75311.1 DNA polymerase III subunit epsilon [Xanthomonadales bacterium]NIO12517.1 DNA polymerase III subunit epsilon [Xanthomonadales bacterium]